MWSLIFGGGNLKRQNKILGVESPMCYFKFSPLLILSYHWGDKQLIAGRSEKRVGRYPGAFLWDMTTVLL